MTGGFVTYVMNRGRMSLTAGAHGNVYRRDHFLFARPDLSTRLYSNRGDKDEVSSFVKLALEQGRVTWLADVQVRRASFAYTPDRNAGIGRQTMDWTFVNPKLGMSMRLTPELSWYASYGSNGREPTRNDMFAGFDNLDTTNAAFVGPLDRVRAERVRDAEAGVTYRSAAAELSANLFDMRFRNEIAPIGALSYGGGAGRGRCAGRGARGRS